MLYLVSEAGVMVGTSVMNGLLTLALSRAPAPAAKRSTPGTGPWTWEAGERTGAAVVCRGPGGPVPVGGLVVAGGGCVCR